MKFKDRADGGCEVSESGDGLNPELREAIRDFRSSVCAWSEAAMNRPRTVVEVDRRWRWQLATTLALGCVLIAGGLSGGIFRHSPVRQTAGWVQKQETQIAGPRVVEPERPVVAQRNQQTHEEEEDLLVKVDTDISRQVPAAMEPLAQLMAADESR
jgi:hypothetical protein